MTGVLSTVTQKDIAGCAGKSAFSVDSWREGAKYACAEGADGVYVKGSGEPLSFTFERTARDEAAFSHFTALEVDGAVLKSGSRYNASSGSVKAELLPAYLDTLPRGEYKLTAVFDGEKAVTVKFTVQARPGSFEAVAVPSGTFTFRKVWEGGGRDSIDFTLYKADDSVYRHGFDKRVISPTEWRYNAWFSEPAACYVVEKPVDGYRTRYENVGVYAHITDRCCDGGTIINYRVPKTGDEAPLWPVARLRAGRAYGDGRRRPYRETEENAQRINLFFSAAYRGKRRYAPPVSGEASCISNGSRGRTGRADIKNVARVFAGTGWPRYCWAPP